jgi:hypothetical protein
MNKEQVFNEALALTYKEVQKISKKTKVSDGDREYLLRVIRETKADKQEIDINWASDLTDDDLLLMLNERKTDGQPTNGQTTNN